MQRFIFAASLVVCVVAGHGQAQVADDRQVKIQKSYLVRVAMSGTVEKCVMALDHYFARPSPHRVEIVRDSCGPHQNMLDQKTRLDAELTEAELEKVMEDFRESKYFHDLARKQVRYEWMWPEFIAIEGEQR